MVKSSKNGLLPRKLKENSDMIMLQLEEFAKENVNKPMAINGLTLLDNHS